MPNKFIIDWIDEDGERARSSWWTNSTDPADAANMIAALQDLSYARLTRYGILRQDTPNVAINATPNAVYDIADKGVLVFEDANGEAYEWSFPCPKSVILPNSDDIDITLPAITTLSDAIKAVVKTRGGESIDKLVRGYRTRTARS